MPTLKYKNSQGNYVALANYLITPYVTDGTYNASTNKVATVSSIDSRIPTIVAAVESQLPGDETPVSGGTDLSFVTTGDKYIWNEAASLAASAVSETAFLSGVTTASSVANLSVAHRFAIVTVSSASSGQTLSLSGISNASTLYTNFRAGREIHIIVKNNDSSNDLTITIPNTGIFVDVTGEGSITVSKGGGYGEINLISSASSGSGGLVYIRAISS